MTFREFNLRLARKLYTTIFPNAWRTDRYVCYFNQEANDFIRESIEKNVKGLMIAKFGTNELDTVLFQTLKNDSFSAFSDMVHNRRHIFEKEISSLSLNMGFLNGNSNAERERFKNLYLDDIKQIDILGSYLHSEHYLEEELSDCVRVNLNGYYAPFLWNNPWTKSLTEKRVLVVSPFVNSIRKQYMRRESLFSDKTVLPSFKELITIKAVQTIAGNNNENFASWFDALQYMKNLISDKKFDIALIGCGAYGLPLAAHVKRMGKIAVHLGANLQLLFGIYGNRWLKDLPEFSKYINENWIRPSANERPKGLETIENGCYW